MTPAAIAEQLALFVGPDQVTELRALHVGQRGRTFAGWFDGRHLADLARHALALAREAAGVYFVPNPIDPSLLARRPNTTANVYRDKPPLTRDDDVPERRYLIVDIDPRRERAPADGPTSARELAFARRLADRFVRPHLRSCGFADAVVMCSGNGVHLAYRLSAPVPGGKCGPRDPLALFLRGLADRFDCWAIAIDPDTYTPARMLKVPGTVVRKGEPSKWRPHRLARILETPDGWPRPADGAVQRPELAQPELVG